MERKKEESSFPPLHRDKTKGRGKKSGAELTIRLQIYGSQGKGRGKDSLMLGGGGKGKEHEHQLCYFYHMKREGGEKKKQTDYRRQPVDKETKKRGVGGSFISK